MADEASSNIAEVKPVEPQAPEGVIPAAATKDAEAKTAVSEEGKKKAASAAAKVDAGKKKNTKANVGEKKRLLEAEKIFKEGIASIRDLIAPSAYEVAFDHVKIDGMFAQTFFVYTYPRYIETNWLTPIVNYDVTMDVSQYIYPISSAEIMKVLKRKVAQLQSSIRMASEKGNVRDPALETALQDAEQLRTELQRGQEKFFQFGMYFTIYSETEEELKRSSKELQSLLAGKLVLTKRSDLQQERGFNSTIPICLDELQVDRNMNTSPLSTTFPFISSDLTSNDGILYGLNRHNESLIIFDRFSLENANSVVFAKSGSGKSYTVKLEILRSLMLGTDVIVIDPENEYKSLCDTVGGTYLGVSLNSDRRINPFDLPVPLENEELKPGDLLRSSVINLTGLMRLMLGEISAQEEGILDKALIDTYATRGITLDVADPSQFDVPTMTDFHNVLSSMDGAVDMAQRISRYTTGTFSGIFNKETNLTLDSGLMVFSIRDLEDELRPIAMYIILNYIWNRVRSSLKKRILVIDEAWTMMQYEDSAKFLFGLVKRARKYYLGVTTITQDVEDFIHSAYGKPIVTNSSMQILLKQSPSAIEPLQKVFNLTEGEKYMLLNSGVGQGLFFAGLKHVAIQVIASFSEDKVVTTNPEELLAQGSVSADFESAEAGEVPAEEAPQTAAEVQAQVEAKQVAAATEPQVETLSEEEKAEEANFEENVAVVLDQAIEAPQNVAEGAPIAAQSVAEAPIVVETPAIQEVEVQEQVQPVVQLDLAAPEPEPIPVVAEVPAPAVPVEAPKFEAQGPITIDSPAPAPKPEPVMVAQAAAIPEVAVSPVVPTNEQDIPVDFS
jgi:conjugal transfer ATP-binding protein TraC